MALKTLLGLTLLSFATLRQAGMEEREAADVVNDFGRSGVGDSPADVVSPSRGPRAVKAADRHLGLRKGYVSHAVQGRRRSAPLSIAVRPVI